MPPLAGCAAWLSRLCCSGSAADLSYTTPDSLPENARLSQHGRDGWDCLRGCHKDHGRCVAIKVPLHAYLESSGSRWTCDRGYIKAAETCKAINRPANAYLHDSSFSRGWQCNRGSCDSDGSCARVVVPPNGCLVGSSYGLGWDCEPGYRLSGAMCVAIKVSQKIRSRVQTGKGLLCRLQSAAKAHIDYSGDR